MSHLTLNQKPTWHANINQVETNEPITGGVNGNANLATRQLAENAVFLKNLIETLTESGTATAQTLNEFTGRYDYQLGIEYADGRKEDSFAVLPLGKVGDSALMIQFGDVKMDRHPGEGAYNLTFNRPFGTKCLGFFATPKVARQGGQGVDSTVTIFELTRTTAKLNLQLFSESLVTDWRGFYWFAIGY